MDSEPIQRNVCLSKTTIDRLNTLNVWGRMGPSELTDMAIRLLYDVVRLTQDSTGCDIQSILGQLQTAVRDPTVRDRMTHYRLGQTEPPVAPELAELIHIISDSKEVCNMFNDSTDSAKAIEYTSNNGGGSP